MSNANEWGGDWTVQKVNTLRDYLQAYQTALKNTGFHRSYVDALAGDGTWRRRSSDQNSLLGIDDAERDAVGRIREGTALAAIGVDPSFDRFVFNDLDEAKAQRLRNRAVEQGVNIDSIEIQARDANDVVQQFCISLNSKRQRGVVLLDPWGMQVNWSTVESIANSKCLDMWYLFPTQAVLRMLPHAGEPSEAWCDRLDATLGSRSWRTEFYRPVVSEGDLFSAPQEHVERKASFAGVEAFVIHRFRETFRGSVLDEPLRLGPRNRPIFSFCFASANPSGAARELTRRLAQGVVQANREL